MSKGAFVGGVAVGLIAAATFSGASDPDEVQSEPDTITVTEEVEVIREVKKEVFVWSDECRSYTSLVDNTWKEIDAYEDGVTPQLDIANDFLGAMIAQEGQGVNDAIQRQQDLLNNTTGPLQRIIENTNVRLPKAREACLNTLEDN